jgi:hypothetical protein
MAKIEPVFYTRAVLPQTGEEALTAFTLMVTE